MKFIILFIFIWAVAFLNAETYDLQKLVEIAQKKSAIIEAKDLEAKASGSIVEQSRLWPNPTLGADFGSINQGSNFGLTYSINVSQPIFFFGKQKLRTTLLVYNQQLSNLSLQEKKRLIEFNVIQAAYQYKTLKDLSEHFVERLDRFKLLKAAIISRPAVSPEIGAQKLIIENALSEAEKEYIELQKDLSIAWQNLNFYLQEPKTVNLDLAYFTKATLLSREDLWQQSLQNNIVVQQLLVQIQFSKANVDLASREAYPDFNIGGFYSQDTGSFQEQRFGLSVSLPLPIFNRNQYSVKAAEDLAKAAEKEQQHALEILRKDFNSAFEEYLANCKLVEKFPISGIVQLDNQFQNLVTEFIKGRLSILTFLEVELRTHNAHLSAFRSQQNYISALLQLHFLSGNAGFSRSLK